MSSPFINPYKDFHRNYDSVFSAEKNIFQKVAAVKGWLGSASVIVNDRGTPNQWFSLERAFLFVL